MTDEEYQYQQLKEKYDKKCARVSELLHKYKLLRLDYDWLDRSRDKALALRDSLEEKNKILESMLPHNYYKIIYKAMGYAKKTSEKIGITEFKEIIFSCHPRIAVQELQNKCTDFELISIEKMG